MPDTQNHPHLKLGDVVAVRSALRGFYSLCTVTGATPKQIALDNGLKYRRDDGRQIGGHDWGRTWLTVEPHALLAAKSSAAFNLLNQKLSLTTEDVIRARSAADYAEQILREKGEWTASRPPISDAAVEAALDAYDPFWRDPTHLESSKTRMRAALEAAGRV